MISGTLYVVGVGPGDPELLTLKALRILREVPVVFVPKGREDGSSLALSIVQRALDLGSKEIIEAHFPMKKTKEAEARTELDPKWHQTCGAILDRINRGSDAAFITIGDPTIYSTFFYLYDRLLELKPDLTVEIIPGVSSVNAAASKARLSLGLGDEKIAIIPATYTASVKGVLESFDTVVMMKVHKVFDSLMKTLGELDLMRNAVYISNAGMEGEKIVRNLTEVKEEDLSYFSMVIVRK